MLTIIHTYIHTNSSNRHNRARGLPDWEKLGANKIVRVNTLK
jgi:hypothetical protein